MKRDCKKGFYYEKCQFEASILFVLCLGWVPALVLCLQRCYASFPTLRGRVLTERPVQRTLSVRTVLFGDFSGVRWTWGGGAVPAGKPAQ